MTDPTHDPRKHALPIEPRRSEFPLGADTWDDTATRREFLKLLSINALLAGASACTRAPSGRIVPYTSQPPEVTPGVPNYYATSMVLDGYATGLLVESHEGRPTKVEGNPQHPASLGATGVFEQASILGLYDPSRARVLHHRGEPRTWDAFVQEFGTTEAGPRGASRQTHFLMEPVSSPLVVQMIREIRTRNPGAQFHFYSPLARDSTWEGTRIAFGSPLECQYDLQTANVVVALDADFLSAMPMHVRHERHFANRRRVRTASDTMNRLYVVESSLTVTGAAADHRLGVQRRSTGAMAVALLAETLTGLGALPAALNQVLARFRKIDLAPRYRHWVEVVARDLRANAGASLVLVGDTQPSEVHAMAHVLNAALGNAGLGVAYTDSPIFEAGGPTHGLSPLLSALDAGSVDTLVILEGNPSYTAPADADFSRRLRSVRRPAYLGLYENETARDCHWFLPAAHFLESWGDARSGDGTVSFVQPLIAPLYGGRTPPEVLAVFLGQTQPDGHKLLRDFWQIFDRSGDFETFWEASIQRGLLPDTRTTALETRLQWDTVAVRLAALEFVEPGRGNLEVSLTVDSRVYDGRFTNNAWLLELPDPITKLTWDNAALLSPVTAARLGLHSEDVVEISQGQRRLRAPVILVPGQADETVTLSLGYGRQGSEELARGRGSNAYALRTSNALHAASGVSLTKVPGRWDLATTQTHWSTEDREPVKRATLAEYQHNPKFAAHANREPETLYFLRPTGAHQWGMSIDLTVCTGCNSCVVACQAENNIPVVGKTGVRKSREMHWLRIDRYFTGPVTDPGVAMQPMLCQHCEKAPCEYVCPVYATVHSPDGLNEQVYNRCVGTRFCSNNCPYKVRRFNYLHYTRNMPETVRMAQNPDVTVRERGVMEKCTFCVQRIREAEIASRIAARPLRSDEVRTACQQACPSRAIVFGLVSDPNAEVTRLGSNDRAYAVLNELGTLPRVRYLAKLTNPNPELEHRVS